MNDEKRKSEAEKRLDHYLTQHHLRHTPERELILGVVTTLRGEFTPMALRESLSGTGISLSQATVYNCLNLFEKAGLVRRRLSDGHSVVYESASESERHIVLACSKCGRRREVRDMELTKMIGVRRFASFTMDGFELIVRGLCSKCRSGGRVKKRDII